MGRKIKVVVLMLLLATSLSFAKQRLFVDVASGSIGLYPNLSFTVSAMAGVTEAAGPVTLGVRAGVSKKSTLGVWLRGVAEYPFYTEGDNTFFGQLMFGPYYDSSAGLSFGGRVALGYEYSPMEWDNVSLQAKFNVRYTIGDRFFFVFLSAGPRFYLDVLE